MNPLLATAVVMPTNVLLGLVFFALAFAATFLMYRLWGYPYDKATRTSTAPRWAMWLHRGLGYAFVLCYLVMMWRMVPRLWSYQVEFPARTVVHIVLAVTIGFLLLIKISIIRFFRHFDEWMPYLGTALLFCTIVLLTLSLPPFLHESALARDAPGGDPFSGASRERVARLLPDAGLPQGIDLAELTSARALRAGRVVVIEKCTACHDLKTILEKPRTPRAWWSTVERMGEKPALFTPLSEEELLRATAYLIAITPDLQKAAKRRRADDEARQDAMDDLASDPLLDDVELDAGVPVDDAGADAREALDGGTAAAIDAGGAADPGPTKAAGAPVDPAKAKAVFARRCSECHELSDVDADPPTSRAAARSMVRRMVENGLEAPRRELDLIVWWLDAHYVRKAE